MYGLYKTTLVAALLAACSVLLTSAITTEPRSTPKAGPDSSIVLPTSSTGILSQCGDYYTFSAKKEVYGVVPDEYDKDFVPVPAMTVPVYGFMADAPFKIDEALTMEQGKNAYTIAEINRALWDGHSFIWLEKDVPAETYDYITAYADSWNKTHEKKVIALTWNGTKNLPQGRDFAFSSWSISQSCMSFSEAAFEKFLEQAKVHNAGRDISVLPLATLTADGSLPKG